jgi:DNA-binding NtrC family response regulator
MVAATNSDLGAEVVTGRFRQDLFYRLNVIPIQVPPLRHRVEDIPLLVEHFLQVLSARIGRAAPRLEDHVLQDLMAYPWPGNVRELRNVLERALILQPEPVIGSLDLPPMEGLSRSTSDARSGDLTLRSKLAETERGLVLEALARAGGVRKEAARLLGIDPRNLPYYLRKHGISPDGG